MSDLHKLQYWLDRVEDLTREMGLTFYPQKFILCSKEKMLEKQVHHGGYYMYSHWSFGKQFTIDKILYEHKFFFLPYEMVVNTNPCEAFLLGENPLVYNILIAAHVYAHNDFFRHNKAFNETQPERIQRQIRRGCDLIDGHAEDHKIGPGKVVKLLDAAHAAMFTNCGQGPHVRRGTILDFIVENAQSLESWELDILRFIQTVSGHLMPQLRTKVMNEGWATFWHYQMLRKLEKEIRTKLSFDDYFQAYQLHLSVIRLGQEDITVLNPYRIGFATWSKIAETHGVPFAFNVRQSQTDHEFLLDHFNGQDFIYKWFVKPGYVDKILAKSPRIRPWDVIPPNDRADRIADFTELVRKSVWGNGTPRFQLSVKYIDNKPALVIKHQFDGRLLNQNQIAGTLKLLNYLWRGKIILQTRKLHQGKAEPAEWKCFDGDKIIVS